MERAELVDFRLAEVARKTVLKVAGKLFIIDLSRADALTYTPEQWREIQRLKNMSLTAQRIAENLIDSIVTCVYED